MRCRRRLERAIESSCRPELPWAGRVAAAIRAALEFAEADPVAARVVTVHSACRRYGGSPAFAALLEDLSARLAAGAPPLRDPARAAENVVLRVMRQTLLQLELVRDRPTLIAPDLIVFALTPYVGLVEAQHWASAGGQGSRRARN